MIENNMNNLDVKSELNNEKGNKKYNKRTYKPRKENNNGEKEPKTKKTVKNNMDENKAVKIRKGNGSILDLPTFKKSNLKIIALGGLDEIGKNITIFEYEDEIVLVDCGLEFPDDDMLGVDIVIPDVTYLVRNKNKIKGLFITHGHEDHIGAIPYVLKQVNMPIYATRLTAKLIEHKLEEHRLLRTTKLNIVEQGQIINAGKMSVEFIRSSHSIPDACMLAIHTPAGVVVHTGDFKVDYTPIDGQIIDFARLAELGSKGVLALLADSTNSERKGFTLSEKSIGPVFDSLFEGCKKRIVVATFASNVHRVQQIVNSAVKFGRKIAVSGRSMINMINSARELNYIDAPDNLFIDIDNIKNYTDEQLVIMTTGSQGETMSALTRMANGEHRKVNLTGNDLVIISATPIPGNEKSVSKVINQLMKIGCEVVYSSLADVHVSGHACQEEQKLILSLVKPKYFLPVHGEFRQLMAHRDTAIEMGIDKNNIFITSNGRVLEVNETEAKFTTSVPSGKVMVDGLGVGDVGSVVLRDRQHLSQDGLIVIVMSMDGQTGEIVSGPDVISRGFVYVRESENLMDDVKSFIKEEIDSMVEKHIRDWSTIKSTLKDDVRDFIFNMTKRNPMILPIIMEV
ncbi:MAG: ribonuclease J [Clostridiales bacterium]|nr:ribonuclease J [Clostridiales bacterium]